MGRLATGLLVAIGVGLVASRALVWLAFDPAGSLPAALAVGAIAAWPWIRPWWGGPFSRWAMRWLAAAAVVLALMHWGCPAAR